MERLEQVKVIIDNPTECMPAGTLLLKSPKEYLPAMAMLSRLQKTGCIQEFTTLKFEITRNGGATWEEATTKILDKNKDYVCWSKLFEQFKPRHYIIVEWIDREEARELYERIKGNDGTYVEMDGIQAQGREWWDRSGHKTNDRFVLEDLMQHESGCESEDGLTAMSYHYQKAVFSVQKGTKFVNGLDELILEKYPSMPIKAFTELYKKYNELEGNW